MTRIQITQIPHKMSARRVSVNNLRLWKDIVEGIVEGIIESKSFPKSFTKLSR